MNRAVISIGSNINPDRNIKGAITLLEEDLKILGKSKFVRTKPIGYPHQPDFINGALLTATELELNELITLLKSIEKKLKRSKTGNKYGPRTIDLDVVVWNGKIIDADFYERDFVKKAVLELLPDFGKNNGH